LASAIRDAHAAKATPARAKTTSTALRAVTARAGAETAAGGVIERVSSVVLPDVESIR
jgi:hypothetical protein